MLPQQMVLNLQPSVDICEEVDVVDSLLENGSFLQFTVRANEKITKFIDLTIDGRSALK